MKKRITEDKLQSLFNGMMTEYTDLESSEHDYDDEFNNYDEFTTLNFYMDDDDFENDDWLFKYAENPPNGEPVEGYETPVLIYYKDIFKPLIEMFGDKFNNLLINWFELTYDLPVKSVLHDYDGYKFLGN